VKKLGDENRKYVFNEKIVMNCAEKGHLLEIHLLEIHLLKKTA
jgi:hypothetical protein